ncbi:MAG: HAD-IA family hydrolase [Lachnospiraceae bacterium]|nr:HAD-IA family hydrolase [Lachnospiraceae bacterium]
MQYTSLGSIAAAFDDPAVSVISFDIFDTLLVRPAGSEDVRFGLLDRRFGELSASHTNFAGIRKLAEEQLRRQIIRGELSKEDVTLDEIYDVIHSDFLIAPDLAAAMKEEEFLMERRLCRPRASGAELYRRALQTGKKVILISDMYLTADRIRILLDDAGYRNDAGLFVSSETGTRKISGRLYLDAAAAMAVRPEQILHIGDNEESDVQAARKAGLRAVLLPGSMDVFRSHGCALQVRKICRDLTDWEKAEREPGISVMRQMAANLYFDDPFRPFDPQSDYNADPYFAGYAALGPELLALTLWIAGNLERDHAESILFLSRDGFLPMRAYELLGKYSGRQLPPAGYLHVSRLAMLPVMIREKTDLFDLPVDLSFQTPRKLLRLLSFCLRDDAWSVLAGSDWGGGAYPPDQPFTKDSFCHFIKCLAESAYDGEKHKSAVNRITDYLLHNAEAPVCDGAALFDMGYSGRIAGAVKEASGKDFRVYFFHGDGSGQFRSEAAHNLQIRAFFDFNPYMEATMREYAYLEPAASCIGYAEDLTPVFDEGPAPHYADTAEKLQAGALDFVRDYLRDFGDPGGETFFRYHSAAMPFEAFLRFPSESDRKMYENVLIDDELWGGRRDISLRSLLEARLRKLPDYAKERD